jgi:hypothetical protein
MSIREDGHDDIDYEVATTISAWQREALARVHRRMREQQLGEAFVDPPTEPLLSTLVPDGMVSPLRKAVRS